MKILMKFQTHSLFIDHYPTFCVLIPYREIPEYRCDFVVHVDDGDAVGVAVHGAEVANAADGGGNSLN